MSDLPSELIGEKRGKLTVLSVSSRRGRQGQHHINCKCDCGKTTEVRVNNFKSGRGLSCGCNNKKNSHLNRVNIVINNRSGNSASVSADKMAQGRQRRRIEAIQEQHALKRELSLDYYG
ncbi:MAG: hypothetical protein ACI88H_000116 [Cocleimonas sp.]|jgi:hypothetical protein